MARLLNTLRSPRPLRSTSRREITYFVPMAQEDDGRPVSSPFESVSTEVYFGSGPKLNVPSALLLNSKLLRGETRPPRSICLNDVTSAVGHIIFYYLLTDTYQCLRPKGNSQHERLVDELKNGVGAYNASRKYELLALQETAKNEIQRLAQQLPFPLVLNLLRDLHLDPSASETWLDSFVQSGLKNIFQTPTAFLDYTNLQVEQDKISFSNIILKNLANLLTNDVSPPRADDTEITTSSPEPVAIKQEPAPDSEAISEVEPLPELAEPAPSEREQEMSPTPALAPEPESVEEHAEKPAEEPVEELVAEPEPLQPDPIPEDHAAYEAPNPGGWDHFMTTSIEKPLWPEDEPVAVPEVSPEPAPEPAPEKPEVEVQYSPPRVEYLDVEQEPEVAPSIISKKDKKDKKKKKKKLSIFRTEGDATPEPKFDSDDTPVPEPETKTADDALSPASSSGLTTTKKKKKISIFRTEDGTTF
ncbi:hypothetical protein FHL15_002031 [Xylaria flabelliformis]|uniref:BTB domain-containing protein n=1 Tax=Xylaria flabelliformis TaxID=2512241 RepID=A0A553IAM0_9PEZI|nr:hypothetical protein FHL15_002031 [Xylaria flabelliformis]